MSNNGKISKVYFYGASGPWNTVDEKMQIKIGFTNNSLKKRRQSILSGQMMNIDLYLLAAIRGTSAHESELKKYFAHIKDDARSNETFYAAPELVEYINWLRHQWWVILDEEEHNDDIPDWPAWRPERERRIPLANVKTDGLLFASDLSYCGPLAGTRWNRLYTPAPKGGEDFYTPLEIIEAARQAMGSIDLDAASHALANREFRIPDYFHSSRRAEDNRWYGRVWLNPPHRGYEPWFIEIEKYWNNKDIQQLCMIAPVWAFTTQQAKRIVTLSSTMLLLTPTPQFWGAPSGSTGSNHPHAIMYLGNRVDDFREAFSKFGHSFRLGV